MIGKQAEAALNRAVKFAVDRDHEYLTVEHVLWSLLAEPEVRQTIEACGAPASDMRREIESHLDQEVPKVSAKSDDPSSPETSVRAGSATEGMDHPVATLGIQRLIQRALFHVQSAGKDEIQPVDLFVAIFQAKDSRALYMLEKYGIERLDALNFISHGVSKGGADDSEGGEAGEPESEKDSLASEIKQEMKKGGGNRHADALKTYAINLNERAKQGKVDPLIGRKVELERMIQTLCRRRKNNPLLVGEAGVGKTALAEGLALRIVSGEVPDLLHKAEVYALDLGSIIAGAKFRGDFEQRLKAVLASLEKRKEKGFIPILLIDEIHTIVGAGAVSGGALDAANLLKPALSRGELRCIGSTTYAEYRSVFEKDHALARRFQKIDVAEPSQPEAIQILEGLKGRFEEHHGIRYSPEAVRAAVELSAKHLTDRFLPDKAIDVLDEAGARARLRGATAGTVLDAEAIEAVIAQIARIPERTVSVSQKDRLKNLERDLKIAIFGQDHAIEALVTAIRLARSGLRSGDRPVGSFLFCGPTGVGKTELSRQLSHALGVPLHRFDMSEYGEKHTVSRLIGAPPGYVGFEQAGLLTDALVKNPHAVILLDEIEKSHADIWNILLQVMDHGTLTDNNGRKADFRNAILIMTSNVGSRELDRRPLGMTQAQSKGSDASRAVEQTFTPEFRNRLDGIIYFNPLDPMTVAQVVGKQIVELESQLLAKNVSVHVTADARELLARKGYDRQMGARPMARLIQDRIKKPLATEILFGKLESGGAVTVSTTPDHEELVLDCRPASGGDASESGSSVTEDVERGEG